MTYELPKYMKDGKVKWSQIFIDVGYAWSGNVLSDATEIFKAIDTNARAEAVKKNNDEWAKIVIGVVAFERERIADLLTKKYANFSTPSRVLAEDICNMIKEMNDDG